MRVLDLIAQEIDLCAAATAYGVVIADRIFDHREHGVGKVRVEDVVLAQKRTQDKPHRDGSVIGFVEVICIEADEIHRLLALYVYDSQNFALSNDVRPWLAWCDHDVASYCPVFDQGRLFSIYARGFVKK